ncbi:MAG: IS21-like element helper ATPase IstB [Thiobacillus sp.]
MLMNQTIDKLNHMKFFGMVKGLEEQAANPEAGALSFEERMSLLVDRELTDRDDRRLGRLLKAARLKLPACLENLDYRASRGLDRSLVASLASFDWLERQQHNMIVTGATGTGKTYLACAFGNGACRRGYKTLYLRVPNLLEELKIARVDGSYLRLMTRLGRAQLLILDDFGLSALSEVEAKDILEVIEECQGKCSVIVAGQLPVESWHQALGNPTVADAILDRLVHSAYKFNLKGDSMRKKTMQNQEAKSATM